MSDSRINLNIFNKGGYPMCKRSRIIGLALMIIFILSFIGFGWAVEPKNKGELIALRADLGEQVYAVDVCGNNTMEHLLKISEGLGIWAKEGEGTEVKPCLAERWALSSDGLTWDIYIRKGIQFHEGWGEFTAEDAKFTYEQVGAPGSRVSSAWVFRVGDKGMVESYTVVDPYHLRIKTKKMIVDLDHHLCSVPMVSKKYFTEVGRDKAMLKPIGTGPWRFVEQKKAEYIKLEAVDNHWRKTPDFKYLIIKAVPELSARVAMLEAGQADLGEIPAEKINEVEEAGLWIKRIPAQTFVCVCLGGTVLSTREHFDPTLPWAYHTDEPWDSAWNQKAYKVRLALAMAIDKKAIMEKIFHGAAQDGPIHSWPLGTEWCNPGWKNYPDDPEKAKQLLAEAGYPNGFKKPITFQLVPYDACPLLIKIDQVICDYWEAIGLKVERVMTESAPIRQAWCDRNTAWTVFATSWGMDPEPWQSARYVKSTSANFNEGFEHPECDKLIAAVGNEPDREKRIEEAKALGQFCYDRIADIGICNPDAVIALSSKVAGWTASINCPWSPYNYEYVEAK